MRDLKYRMQLELIVDSFGTSKKGDIEMFYFNLLDENIGLARLPISKNWKIILCDQYTGLTDKNGVEIYENDIVVKESYGRRSKPMKVEYIGHVIEPFNYGNENHETISPSDCIVIGNLHQNSDLLK
jgi:hypothetical protein